MLTKCGVPWEIATALPDEYRLGWAIGSGNAGLPKDKWFDWLRMEFPELT